MLKFKQPFLFVSMWILFSGCLSNTTQTIYSQTVTRPIELTLSSTITPNATTTIMPPTANTPLATTLPLTIPTPYSQTQTPTAARMSVPTLSESSTLVPTLSGSKQKEFIVELLKTNADCRLPCWWGIIPGETTWQETHRLLSYIGLPVYHTVSDDFDLYGSWIEYKGPVYNDINFFKKKDLIEYVSIRVEGFKNPSWVFQNWRKYSPEQIIQDLGQPSRILISLFGSETGRVYYYLFLFFDDQGVLAFYEGLAFQSKVDDQITYRVCPTWQDSMWLPEIRLYLQSPDRQIPLDQLADLSSNPRNLEDVSQTTVEEFTLGIESKPACFDTPISIWP